jgi:hypothetical protein
MKKLPLLALATCFGAIVVGAACGEDTALVRLRLDGGGGDAALDGALDGGSGALACGMAVPTTYESAAFAQNAAVELSLAQRFVELGDKMRSAEGESTETVTANDLNGIYSAGAPSLRAVSTTGAQSLADGYFSAFEAAMGKTWQPADAEQDGGAPSGGKFDDFVVNPVGVDLRVAVEKTLLGGALYNHVLGLVAAPVTETTVDKLVAAFGASPAFANRTGADAGVDADRLLASHASRLDGTSAEIPGPYRRTKTALLRMKAAAKGGENCRADLDEAVTTFLTEWERSTYGAAIFYLSAAATSAANPTAGASTLHAYGEALGFIQSFKGVSRRKITDAQIDALLVKVGAADPYKLVTSPGDRSLKLNEAINDIALYEGLTPDEVQRFRQPL